MQVLEFDLEKYLHVWTSGNKVFIAIVWQCIHFFSE